MSRITNALKSVEQERQQKKEESGILADNYFGNLYEKKRISLTLNKNQLIGIVFCCASFILVSYALGLKAGLDTQLKTIQQTGKIALPEQTLAQPRTEKIVEAASVALPVSFSESEQKSLEKMLEKATASVKNPELRGIQSKQDLVTDALATQKKIISGEKKVDQKALDRLTEILWKYANGLEKEGQYKKAKVVYKMIFEKLPRGRVRDYQGFPHEILSTTQGRIDLLDKKISSLTPTLK
ncbi:MAG: hypothetical protein KAR00_03330 [Candidatus Pacebacteria bacterium]|nr:hypothetical protein [Candidatus Paceibacterota bacterium]